MVWLGILLGSRIIGRRDRAWGLVYCWFVGLRWDGMGCDGLEWNGMGCLVAMMGEIREIRGGVSRGKSQDERICFGAGGHRAGIGIGNWWLWGWFLWLSFSFLRTHTVMRQTYSRYEWHRWESQRTLNVNADGKCSLWILIGPSVALVMNREAAKRFVFLSQSMALAARKFAMQCNAYILISEVFVMVLTEGSHYLIGDKFWGMFLGDKVVMLVVLLEK